MIRLKTTFTDISADTLYDVLHDPVYRKVDIISLLNLIPKSLHFRAGTSTWSARENLDLSTPTMTSPTTPSTVRLLWRTGTLSSRDLGYKHHRRCGALISEPISEMSIKDSICFSITSSTTVSFTESTRLREVLWGACPTWQDSSSLLWEVRAATLATWLTPTQVRERERGGVRGVLFRRTIAVLGYKQTLLYPGSQDGEENT